MVRQDCERDCLGDFRELLRRFELTVAEVVDNNRNSPSVYKFRINAERHPVGDPASDPNQHLHCVFLNRIFVSVVDFAARFTDEARDFSVRPHQRETRWETKTPAPLEVSVISRLFNVD
jgi:hypothetical protein